MNRLVDIGTESNGFDPMYARPMAAVFLLQNVRMKDVFDIHVDVYCMCLLRSELKGQSSAARYL